MFDRDFDGVGELARGFARESQPGFTYSEYMIYARNGNLLVKVWLAVGGTTFVPKETLAAEAVAILKATLAAVPQE